MQSILPGVNGRMFDRDWGGMFRQNCFQLRFSFNPSARVFTILSRTFVLPFMAALSTEPTIEKKRNYQFRKAEQAAE